MSLSWSLVLLSICIKQWRSEVIKIHRCFHLKDRHELCLSCFSVHNVLFLSPFSLLQFHFSCLKILNGKFYISQSISIKLLVSHFIYLLIIIWNAEGWSDNLLPYQIPQCLPHWVRLKPSAYSSFLVSHISTRELSILAITHCFPSCISRDAKLGAEYLDSNLTPCHTMGHPKKNPNILMSHVSMLYSLHIC